MTQDANSTNVQRPVSRPFHEFVLKVHGGCQLACDYCYMYTSVGAWQAMARPMSSDTVVQVSRRIAEHATRHDLACLKVVFHGGEPLLSGAHTLTRAADQLRREVRSGTTIDFVLQTNGLLLTERSLETLTTAGIRIGVSVDGDRTANDRHRQFRNGQGSHAKVSRALALLKRRPSAYAGILAVIDLENPPVQTYEALLDYAPPVLDFLLPHGNWSAPPPHRPPDDSTPYADWLIPVFDRWYGAPKRETRVRLFEEILNGLLGGVSRSESIGLGPVGVIVVNVDGAMEQVDALRTTYAGAVDTALNVFDHAFDDAMTHDDVRMRQQGAAGLSADCRACPIVAVCGGGYYPHRYRRDGSSFANPSVFCRDLFRLIGHMGDRIRADVARIVRHTRYARTHVGGT